MERVSVGRSSTLSSPFSIPASPPFFMRTCAPVRLCTAIEKSGYYPDVVSDSVNAAVAGEPVVAFLVHHEPTIDQDEVRRDVTVVVLTGSRLILAHTDEHAPDDLLPAPYTSTSSANSFSIESNSPRPYRWYARLQSSSAASLISVDHMSRAVATIRAPT